MKVWCLAYYNLQGKLKRDYVCAKSLPDALLKIKYRKVVGYKLL